MMKNTTTNESALLSKNDYEKFIKGIVAEAFVNAKELTSEEMEVTVYDALENLIEDIRLNASREIEMQGDESSN